MPSSSSTQEESPLNEHVRIWSIKNAARAHAGLPPLPIPPLDPPVAATAAAAATTTTHMEHDVATFEPPTVTVTLEDEKESSTPRRNTTNHMDYDGTTPSSPSRPPNTLEMTPHRPVPEYTMANHHHRINHGSQNMNTNTNNGNSQLFVLDTTPQTEPTKNDMTAAALSESISISAPYSGGTVTPRVMEWPITTSPVAVEKEEAIAGSNKAPPLVVTDNAATIEAWTTHRHDTDTGVVAAVVVVGETSEDQDQHTGEEEEDEPIILWKEMYMDAQEFELASLTLQRPTAVKRLQELAFRLKEASQRLREKQTKETTDEPTKKRSLDDDTTDGSNSSGLIGTVPRQQRCKKQKTTTNHTNHDIPTTTITQTLRSPPPLLKATDAWVCHHSAWGGNLCPSFEKDNHCPLGAQCPRTHVYRLGPQIQQQQQQTEGSERLKWTKEDVMQVYERYRQRSLIRQDFSEKIKDHWFSARFKCPMDQIYYYAHGTGGRASPQRLEWYSTQKEAHDAVATLVLHALQLRQMIPANVSPILTPPVSNKRSKSAHRRTTIITPPPLVIPWNWMEPHVEKRCGHFLDSKKTCRFGKFCRFSHVHFPTQLTTTTTSTTTTPATGSSSLSDGAPSDQLIEIYKKQFDVLDPAPLLQDCHFTKSVGEHCTAGFKCPVESTIYYAAGGCHSYINSQNIYLYPSPEDALSAVDCIVLNAFIERGLTTTTSRQNNPKPSSSTQIKNNSNNNTQQGEEEEEDSDIADMFGSDDEEEDNQEKDTVNQKHEKHPNSAESDADVDTHEMFDSDDNTDEQERFDTNDNTDASGLPVLKHKDWMVPANKKHCKHFVSSIGCRGNHCKYIHVYSTERKKDDGFPTSDHGMPHDDALAFAYRTNFPSTPLLSPRDFCHLCITCEGKQWHTSALTCPCEQVIYYAAGGKHAARSSQRIYWYPTQEDAKLAVAAVVLRAFSIRGMYGSGRNPFESE